MQQAALFTKTILEVKGMSCDGCVNSIRQVLETLPGVGQITIVLKTGLVTIQYDSSQVSILQIVQKIIDAGYEVQSTS